LGSHDAPPPLPAEDEDAPPPLPEEEDEDEDEEPPPLLPDDDAPPPLPDEDDGPLPEDDALVAREGSVHPAAVQTRTRVNPERAVTKWRDMAVSRRVEGGRRPRVQPMCHRAGRCFPRLR
jgi:hypothetical protein